MFGLTDLIVCLWFVPMTLFIVVPLAMLCAWLTVQLIYRLQGGSRRSEHLEAQVGEKDIFSEARA